jgi:hypothetical protein
VLQGVVVCSQPLAAVVCLVHHLMSPASSAQGSAASCMYSQQITSRSITLVYRTRGHLQAPRLMLIAVLCCAVLCCAAGSLPLPLPVARHRRS